MSNPNSKGFTNSSQALRGVGGRSGFHLSLDVWAVALALALSLLVWSGVIKRVPW